MSHLCRNQQGNQSMLMRLTASILGLLLLMAAFSPVLAQAEELEEAEAFYPKFVQSLGWNNNSQISLYFDESFRINVPEESEQSADEYLTEQLKITADGINFSDLPAWGSAEHKEEYNEILISYSDYIPVINGNKTAVKIPSGVLIDEEDQVNEELVINIAPPVIKSATISEDSKHITVVFEEPVLDMTIDEGESNLIDFVSILNHEVQTGEIKLGEEDAVFVDEEGQLRIELSTPLFGSNKVKINSDIYDMVALATASGAVLTRSIESPSFVANGPVVADRVAPELVNYYVSDNYTKLHLVFNEAIASNVDADSELVNAIAVVNSYNTNTKLIPNEIQISGNVLSLIYSSNLTYSTSTADVTIAPGTIKDLSNNVQGNTLTRSWMYLYSSNILNRYSSWLSKNGAWMTLTFGDTLYDNTLVDGVSTLKDKISYSLDKVNYVSLGEGDQFILDDRELRILFQEPITVGGVWVKVEANVLSSQYGVKKNEAIDLFISSNTPRLKGVMYSDAPSEFVYDSFPEWTDSVKEVSLYSDSSGAKQVLSPSDYTLTDGKLTLKAGLFQKDHYYELLIHADGYSTAYTWSMAIKSKESVYMTAPQISTANGITATVNLVNRAAKLFPDQIASQTIVFQLMDGNTPVSIVTAKMKLDTGTYSATFNVTDAASKSYTVKAFVVSSFDNSLTNVGVNTATIVTPEELRLKEFEIGESNNYYYD